MNKIPKHVAVIMDGNGRWAQRRGLPRMMGHKAGVKSVKKIIESAVSENIQILTLFVFSKDNWSRPQTEINFLMKLLAQSITTEKAHLIEQGVRFQMMGDLTHIDVGLVKQLQDLQSATKLNKKMTLVFAFNYSGRWDILQASQALAQRVQCGEMTVSEIDESTFSAHLAAGDVPEPDLLIRTSGEQRLSNFMLWSLAYTELFFSEKTWPDFTENDLKAALSAYSERHRRFGGLLEPATY